MAQELVHAVADIELPGQVAQKHHREFQALGAVDGHQPHRPRVLIGRLRKALFLPPFQMVQEPLQGAQLPLLKFRSQEVELP